MRTDALTRKLLSNYAAAGREAGYWGNYFLRELRRHGGLEVARSILAKKLHSGLTKGFSKLAEAGRPDLSVEAVVLSSRFRRLFTAEELAVARDRLKECPPSPYPEQVPEGASYPAGAARRVLVNRYERNPRARAKCLAKHGFKCRVCGLVFAARYGAIGEDFMHVHHLRPLAKVKKSYRLDPVKDLAPVCPNCHAMLHRTDPALSLAELKARLRPGS